MKKITALLLALILVFTLVACGGEKEPAKDERIRVVYIINGTLGDKSFFDSGYEGLKMINDKYGDKVYTEYREMTYDNTLWESTAKDIVAEGWDIVIAGTWDMLGYITELAGKYPDTKFWFFDERFDFDTNPYKNVYGMVYAQNEGSYLVGMAAAYMTKTNKVAFLGGMSNTVLNDFMVGYNEGVYKVNKDVTVNVSWANSFSDAAIAKDIANGLYQQSYDVIFSCAGSCGLGTFDAAVEGEGRYVIGVDGDQGAYFASNGQDNKAAVTITSMQKNVNNSFLDAMTKHLDGTLAYGTNAVLGLDGGFVSYSASKTLSADAVAAIEQAKADIIAGTIKVGTAFDADAAVIQSYVDGTWKNNK